MYDYSFTFPVAGSIQKTRNVREVLHATSTAAVAETARYAPPIARANKMNTSIFIL